MRAWLKSVPRVVFILASLVLMLVVIGVLFWKPLRVLRLQARAGGKIEAYRQITAGPYGDYFACQVPAFTDLTADPGLEEAATLLEKAGRLQPDNPQTHLLLGKVNCLREDYGSAIAAFEVFTQMRPDNPLAVFEAAFAHFTPAIASPDLSEKEKVAHEMEALALLEGIGYSGDYFYQEGEAAFTRWPQPAYPAAWYWYRLSQVFQPLPEELQFRVAMMDVVFSGKTDSPTALAAQTVFSINEPLTVPPAAFFRLANGALVNTKKIGERQAAMFYRAVDPGGILFKAGESGTYCLTISALDQPPAPTILEISLDFNQIMTIELPDGDEAWQSFDGEVLLEKGVHLLSVRLSNDDLVDGMDRNGHIGEVMIEKCPE